jgi:hypothetical protein
MNTELPPRQGWDTSFISAAPQQPVEINRCAIFHAVIGFQGTNDASASYDPPSLTRMERAIGWAKIGVQVVRLILLWWSHRIIAIQRFAARATAG